MANMDEEYQVKVSGKGISVDTSTDREMALAVIQLIMGGTPAKPLPRPSGEASSNSGRGAPIKSRASLRDFVDNSGAKNIAAQITAIGAFICESDRKEEFTRDEVEVSFKGAGLPPPKNLSRDFQTALSKGWIGEDHKNSGQFFITTQGVKTLEKKFEGTRASSGRGPRKKARKTAKPSKK